MLCGVIKNIDSKNIATPLVELRLDCFKKMDVEVLKKFKGLLIFTLRSKSQGGNYSGSEEERLLHIKRLAALRPEYIDIEYPLPPSFLEELRTLSPETKIIVSYHDFERMPDIEETLAEMKTLDADLYKMAFMLNSSCEALTLLLFMRNHSNVLAMGMGSFGVPTRILAPIFGGKFVYASIDSESKTAPGQLSINELTDIYHHDDLTPSTDIYGLIGDPVNRSPSHITHNTVMHQLSLSSVYVKFPVTASELPEFIDLARNAEINGLSVTMPLKEKIIPLLDEIDPWAKKVGSVNTLHFQDGKIKGYNTDGKGALDAIESKLKVRGKMVIIIGAGGASKALVAEAIDRGADVLILNRSHDKAVELAEKMQCRGGSLDEMCSYDVLINTTPNSMPIDPEKIIPSTVVMDINIRPKNTLLLQNAKEKNCTVVFGYEMFINQALEQFKIWFGNDVDLDKTRKILEGMDYGS